MTPPRQSIHARRAGRARELARRYPASAEGLRFIALLAEEQARLEDRFQSASGWARPAGAAPSHRAGRQLDIAALARDGRPVIDLIRREGPPPLRREAERLASLAGAAGCREMLDRFLHREEATTPRNFAARVMLQAVWAARFPDSAPAVSAAQAGAPGVCCPGCAHLPQVGVVRAIGDGSEFRLQCSLCLGQWPFPRNRCPSCGKSEEGRIAFYGEEKDFRHLRVRACEFCRRYLLQVDLSKEPKAVPDIDELSALPLDAWAIDQGFQKLHPNLLGI